MKNLQPPALLTPASFAREISGNRWLLPRHLALLNRRLMEVAAGRCLRLMVFMPPRHGKSEFISRYFPAWYLGTFPDSRVMLASYEASFAGSWGEKARDAFGEARARGLWTHNLNRRAVSDWSIAGHDGGMVTAGVGGAITGRGGNILLIDDPVKNAEEAQSATYREKAWDWYNSTFATRAEPGAAIVIMMTRWHQDDLAGRILAAAQEPWEIIALPAIAEEGDALGRQLGEALWPERYDADALDTIRRERGSHWWTAMYQQQPTAREGGFFKRHWLEIVDVAPAEAISRVRYWDKAATEGGGDYTCGVRMSNTAEGVFYIENVIRGQLSSGAVREIVKQTAQLDGQAVRVYMEQEPGSSGKDVVADYRRLLTGFAFRGIPATGSKEVRADPLAAQAEGGNVKLMRGPWNEAFIDELCSFPLGAHDDQVDAASGAFNALKKPGTVTTLYV